MEVSPASDCQQIENGKVLGCPGYCQQVRVEDGRVMLFKDRWPLEVSSELVTTVREASEIPVESIESSPVLYRLLGALVWAFSPVSCSPSEPVWAEELVLMGERGISPSGSRRFAELPLIPVSIVRASGILGDAVMSKLSLIFSCLSGRTVADAGLEGSSSIW